MLETFYLSFPFLKERNYMVNYLLKWFACSYFGQYFHFLLKNTVEASGFPLPLL